MQFNKVTIAILIVAVIAAAALLLRPSSNIGEAGPPLVKVSVPDLSPEAKQGEALFNANCASCHGKNAAGQDGIAPPLVHKIYEPNHHADISFQRAAKYGVRAHHWRFGNMPPVDGITPRDVSKVIVYVRELQRANGIF